jgi:NitT/TauT family transport system substrate-binding protein
MRPTISNHKRKWYYVVTFALLLLLFVVEGASVYGASGRGLGTKWDPIKIGNVVFYGFMPSYKVVDMLNERGVFATWYQFPNATERLEAVAGGFLTASYAGLTASTLLAAAGKEIVVLCSTNEGGRAIVARKEIKTLKDLIGKKVGTVFGSIEHISLVGELVNARINPKEVDIVNIPSYPDLPVAMATGGIVAYCGNEPWSQYGVVKYDGHILTYPYNSPMGKIDSGIETTREFVEKYPDLAYAVVKAHVEAVEYYKKSPEECIKEAIKRYQIPQEVAEATVKNTWLSYDINLVNMKALASFLKDFGYIKEYPDWNKFIDDRFLKRAKSELGLK